MKDLKEVTANDVQSYWRCSCGRLSVKLEDGHVITLFSEPHHPSMSAMGGASKVLDLGLISTVQPGLRSRTPLGLQHRVEAKEGG